MSSSPHTASLEAIGLFAPGLPGWNESVALLSAAAGGVAPPDLTAVPAHRAIAPQPQLLPANERRRAPLSVLIALQAAEDAMRRTSIAASDVPCVFGSSDAEMAIVHRICSALAEPARSVSPTDFHNSVHNAAAGYWGIAARATRSATTLSAFDGTLAAGLHEALAMLADGERAVLLVLYDVPPPVPLYEKRPIETACAVALLLAAERSPASLATLSLQHSAQETVMQDPALEALRRGNPAARALPLLAAVARRADEVVGVRRQGGGLLGVRVRCP